MRRQYVWATITLLTGLVAIWLPQSAGGLQSERSIMTIEQHRIIDENDAIKVAKELTGLGELSGVVVTAQRVTVDSDDTPFLAKQLIGIYAWQVTFENVSLQLKSAIKGFQDPYTRKFIVLIREDTGQLWSVKSFFHENVPDLKPEPSAQAAEAQLRPEKEIYTGLPPENPQITFLEALDIVLTQGSGSPFLAKEIHAVYVMESEMGSEPRPVWAVTLRGIPPIPVSGPYADTIPVWQLNRMRHLIHAQTGVLLFATNSPQPEG